MKKPKFKVGDRVRLKGKHGRVEFERGIAKVEVADEDNYVLRFKDYSHGWVKGDNLERVK